ncbi:MULTISPECIES: hypothetical protein [Amycolatopsis]|uniref:Uncharacterized protein n=1 Tax=Amycolatopsis albidoflavus TaxID=102226 RepID=A0ABW5I5Z9_9PSEU
MNDSRTMAERKYQDVVRPNRARQLDDIKADIEHRAAHGLRRRLDTLFTAWAERTEAAAYEHPVDAVLGENSGLVKAAMEELGVPAERLAAVHVGSALDEDVSAQMQPFDDGSGLVLVSDAILALTNVYGLHAGAALGELAGFGSARQMWQSFRMATGGGLGEDPFFLTGLLRYYNVHQRVYGIAAKLGRTEERAGNDIVDLINTSATQFVLGHEIAHHALGHTSAPSAFSPGEHLPACSADAQRELDADLFAHRAVVRVFETQLSGRRKFGRGRGRESPEINATLGALVAILTVHSTETALFIRRGNTHPPAAERAARLLDGLGRRVQQFSPLFLGKMLSSTAASSDFGASVEPFGWAAFYADPRVDTPHPRSYLDQIALFDRLQTAPRAQLLEGLARKSTDSSGILARGAAAALEGDVPGALAIWGVADEWQELLRDRLQPLSFHTALTAVKEAFDEQELDEGLALPGSVVCTALLAEQLA